MAKFTLGLATLSKLWNSPKVQTARANAGQWLERLRSGSNEVIDAAVDYSDPLPDASAPVDAAAEKPFWGREGIIADGIKRILPANSGLVEWLNKTPAALDAAAEPKQRWFGEGGKFAQWREARKEAAATKAAEKAAARLATEEAAKQAAEARAAQVAQQESARLAAKEEPAEQTKANTTVSQDPPAPLPQRVDPPVGPTPNAAIIGTPVDTTVLVTTRRTQTIYMVSSASGRETAYTVDTYAAAVKSLATGNQFLNHVTFRHDKDTPVIVQDLGAVKQTYFAEHDHGHETANFDIRLTVERSRGTLFKEERAVFDLVTTNKDGQLIEHNRRLGEVKIENIVSPDGFLQRTTEIQTFLATAEQFERATLVKNGEIGINAAEEEQAQKFAAFLIERNEFSGQFPDTYVTNKGVVQLGAVTMDDGTFFPYAQDGKMAALVGLYPKGHVTGQPISQEWLENAGDAHEPQLWIARTNAIIAAHEKTAQDQRNADAEARGDFSHLDFGGGDEDDLVTDLPEEELPPPMPAGELENNLTLNDASLDLQAAETTTHSQTSSSSGKWWALGTAVALILSTAAAYIGGFFGGGQPSAPTDNNVVPANRNGALVNRVTDEGYGNASYFKTLLKSGWEKLTSSERKSRLDLEKALEHKLEAMEPIGAPEGKGIAVAGNRDGGLIDAKTGAGYGNASFFNVTSKEDWDKLSEAQKKDREGLQQQVAKGLKDLAPKGENEEVRKPAIRQ